VIFPMSVTADGYVTGPDGDFGWGRPTRRSLDLELVEIRTSGSRVVYLRYRVAR
jgi:hypothetical protein